MDLQTALSLRCAGRHEEALELLVALAAQRPDDAAVCYQAACVHDYLGREAAAIPYYVASLARPSSLTDDELLGAYLGLGSTYRTLGRYPDAEAVLGEGLVRFPRARELQVFLAMVHHNLGRSKKAIEALLTLLADTSSDEGIRQYRRAIALYAQDIERTWPGGG